jgi:hypothetical protein
MHIDASHFRNHFDNMTKVEKLKKILFHNVIGCDGDVLITSSAFAVL